MRRPNFLSGLELDRRSALRSDPEALERVWRRRDTLVLPVWRSKHIVVQNLPPEIAFLGSEAVDGEGRTRVFLGTSGERAYFAMDLSQLDEPIADLGLEPLHALVGLREAAPLLTQSEGALLAYAGGILTWHRRHRYCGVCGQETLPDAGGHVRTCGSEGCHELHFPRTDPAVIMLVTDRHGGECLLGRQSSWPKGVYSTLAGFVEPGESLEEAVRREVEEETGVEIADIQYHSSQPWPFPSSLMLGFTARARTREVRLQLDELEDARWFTRDELRHRKGVELPSAISIARRLIEDWLEEETLP